jgi:hypothetical protein
MVVTAARLSELEAMVALASGPAEAVVEAAIKETRAPADRSVCLRFTAW